jgi:hypothetical protein
MSFKPIILKSEDTLHSVVANKGKFFAVVTKSVQNEGFSRKAVTLVEIEEIVDLKDLTTMTPPKVK